jgi:hypothetical protein
VVTADAVTLDDLVAAQTPTIARLLREGAIGLMNVRAARGSAPIGGYLSLNAGARATVSDWADRSAASAEDLGFNANETYGGEPAGDAYRQITRRKSRAAVLQLGLPMLLRDNATAFDARVGLIGDVLGQAGIGIACLGNQDTFLGRRRPIATLAMDSRGQVPLGAVDAAVVKEDPASLARLCTDQPSLLARFEALLRQAQFIAIDAGDTGRLQGFAEQLMDVAVRSERAKAIRHLDRLLGGVLDRVRRSSETSSRPRDWRLLLLVPNGTKDSQEINALTPALLYGPGVPAGLLTSSSTRVPGIVINADFAATLFDYFGLHSETNLVGQPMRVVPQREAAPGLVERLHSIALSYGQRNNLLRGFVDAAVFLLLLGAAALVAVPALPVSLAGLLRWLLLAVFALPLALLVLPLFQAESIAVAASILTAVVVVIVAVAGLASRRPWWWIALALVVVVAADLLSGGFLLRTSALGHSPVVGARYYGIGNEGGGLLLAAALLVALPWAQGSPTLWRRAAAVVFLVFVWVLLGHPRLGANFGLAIGAGFGFVYAGLRLFVTRPRLRHLGIGAAILLTALGLVALADVLRGTGAQSHVGRFIAEMQVEGAKPFFTLVGRKLAVNVGLTQGRWAYLGLSSLALLFVQFLVARQTPVLGRRDRQLFAAVIPAALIGAAASFAFNDSGTVAAATALVLVAAAFGYMGFAQISSPERPE